MKKLILPFLLVVMALVFANAIKANENKKIYISNNTVYYDCPGGAISAPVSLNIDIDSVEIIDDRFFKDRNNVYAATADSHSGLCLVQKLSSLDAETFAVLNDYYQKDKNNVYKSDNYWGWGAPSKVENADAESFQVLSYHYAKDKYRAYCALDTSLVRIEDADVETFEVLTEEGGAYAIDKNHMYFWGEKVSDKGIEITNNKLYARLKGKIILKVEEKGEAYYISPIKREMQYLSKPVIAFRVMREQGIGITNKNLEKIQVADNYCPNYSPSCDNKDAHDFTFASQHKGKIFLQVEEKGEAWYVNPDNLKRYFLGRPKDALNVMSKLGLGISNESFNNLMK